jgi:hypothetical protein
LSRRPRPATQVNGEAALDLAAKTLSGDLRDQLLELVRDLREPFHKIGESQQEKYVARVSFMVGALIERVVALVAAADFPAIPALLKQATLKDAIEAKVELSRYHESRHMLMDAAGSKVLIVLSGRRRSIPRRASGGPAKIDKDEPELPVELNGVVWVDDAQIVTTRIRKWWAEHPRLVVTAATIEQSAPREARPDPVDRVAELLP